MLGIMRKYQKSIVIKIVFGVIVLSFIGTIFLVWGRGDEGRGGSASYAAKVNGTTIGLDQFQQSYYRLRDIYRQIYGASFDEQTEEKLGLKKTALDSLINEVLVREAADDLGVKVSKQEVVEEIAKNPAFQKNGAFDSDVYHQALRSGRIAPAQFEEAQKDEILGRKTRQKIKEQVTVTDEELLKAYGRDRDRVNLLYVGYGTSDVLSQITISDQDLQAYLDAHKEEFKTPEQISLQYVLVPPAADAQVQVTAEEAEAFYRKNIDRFQGKNGILPFNEVKDRVTADVRKEKAATATYEKAAVALNKHAAAGDIQSAAAALGGKVVETPLFSQAAVPAPLTGESELVRKAFSLKQGEVAGPLETRQGIYILKLKERRAADVPALSRIKALVEPKAKEEKAKEVAKKKAEEALTAFAKGDAAVNASETGLFGYQDKIVPKIGPAPEVAEAAFELTAASPVAKAPFKVGGKWYALKLKERVEASRADFPKMKEQIRQTVLPKKQEEALEKWLKELRGKAKIEINEAVLGK